MNNKIYDIIIIGGGIVGLTFASLLGDSSLKIAIIDANEPVNKIDLNQHDLRVSAITPASQQLFVKLNIWQDLVAQRVSAFKRMAVWDSESQGNIEFNAADIGAMHLGWIIENQLMQTVLFEKAKSFSNIEFIYSVKLQALEKLSNANYQLQFDNQITIETKLLIGADGANSKVRQLADINYKNHTYNHTALVTTVETERSHQQTAWQRFLPSGPLAFLPLINPQHCSIVWSTSDEQAEQLKIMSEDDFVEKLSAAFEYRLGKVKLLSKRLTFPLQMRHVKNYVLSNLALIGDAAHTIHPLAGQGVNMGLQDAICLADVILQAYEQKRDFSALYSLRRYERERKNENLKMLAVVDGLKSLFAKQSPSIKWLRGFGLSLTNRSQLVKNYLMKNAMGVYTKNKFSKGNSLLECVGTVNNNVAKEMLHAIKNNKNN